MTVNHSPLWSAIVGSTATVAEHLVGALIFIPMAYGTICNQNSMEIVTKHPPSMTQSVSMLYKKKII
jgi:hypothetical protein